MTFFPAHNQRFYVAAAPWAARLLRPRQMPPANWLDSWHRLRVASPAGSASGERHQAANTDKKKSKWSK
jgi:hypothetical protein